MQSARGVSLIEATIILLAFAIFVAAAAPVATRVLERARDTRARSDAEAIKGAIIEFTTDTGRKFFTVNGQANGTQVQLLVSDGDIPREVSASGNASWQQAVNLTTGVVDFLENHLVRNQPRGSSANAYPVPTTSPSSTGWRGVYLVAPIDPDPWGNRYAVNVQFMKSPTSPCPNPCSTPDAFVYSPGPDEQIDTVYQKNGITPGDDDVTAVVHRDAGRTLPGG